MSDGPMTPREFAEQLCNICRRTVNYKGLPTIIKLVTEYTAAIRREAQAEATKPFVELFYGLDPFKDGPDGDLCCWCSRERDREIESWQQVRNPEHHYADCQFIASVARLADADKEGK